MNISRNHAKILYREGVGMQHAFPTAHPSLEQLLLLVCGPPKSGQRCCSALTAAVFRAGKPRYALFRQHAFFPCHSSVILLHAGGLPGHWELEILGKNGVTVNGTLHTPSTSETGGCVKLRSGDHLTMGDNSFHFLLPARTIRWALRLRVCVYFQRLAPRPIRLVLDMSMLLQLTASALGTVITKVCPQQG